MKLSGLLKKYDYEVLQGNPEANVKGIAYHSGKVVPGGLFVCIEGYAVDGHDYVDKAIENGATAIICEKPVKAPEGVTVLQLRNTRIALAKVAAMYYNKPSKFFNLIGVTGTNGKTSTVNLIDSMIKNYGKKTGVIGTIENRIGDRVVATENTTPESLDLQRLLYEMKEANVSDVIMEVSSHALKLHRVKYARYDVGIFTNLTQDHLDFHVTMDAYAKAKAKLFKRAKISVINMDDIYGGFMRSKAKGMKVITYGVRAENVDIKAFDIQESMKGNAFKVNCFGEVYDIKTQTPGLFSVYNALAAIGGALAIGIPMANIIDALRQDSRIPGRYETLEGKNGVHAVVDYAHTPDGLLNILRTTNTLKTQKVITVFGCGGDRDTTKRPKMGRIAAEQSDYVIVTSDNPRTEDPEKILDDVEVGVQSVGCPYERIADRKAAIERGLSMAQAGDIVVVAGKGHEDYQIIGKTKIHFDDKEVIRAYFDREDK